MGHLPRHHSWRHCWAIHLSLPPARRRLHCARLKTIKPLGLHVGAPHHAQHTYERQNYERVRDCSSPFSLFTGRLSRHDLTPRNRKWFWVSVLFHPSSFTP